jgi:peroxiredoxin
MKTLLAAVFGLLLAMSASARDISGPAPDFTLKSNQGKNIRLADLRGQVVMLNFWATWCGPCRQEMPLLNELYQRYQPAGFTLLGVNVDADTEQANKMLEDIPVDFPIVYDPNSEVSEAYKVDAMPTSIFIDRNGQMRYLHRGYRAGDEEEYRRLIRELIKE